MGSYDYVSQAFLNDLIRHNKIIQFFRSNGWATIGVDPVRISNDIASGYTGPDRRGAPKDVSFGVGLAKPLIKKALYALPIGLTLITSILIGTVRLYSVHPSSLKTLVQKRGSTKEV